MDRGVLIDLEKHYEEKIKKRQTISARKTISHIDAFYGQSHSGGLLKQGSSFLGGTNENRNQ